METNNKQKITIQLKPKTPTNATSADSKDPDPPIVDINKPDSPSEKGILPIKIKKKVHATDINMTSQSQLEPKPEVENTISNVKRRQKIICDQNNMISEINKVTTESLENKIIRKKKDDTDEKPTNVVIIRKKKIHRSLLRATINLCHHQI